MVVGKKKTLADRLLKYAEKHPDGFTVKIVNGRIRVVKGSTRKRFIVSYTNYDTVDKIKKGFRGGYSGYAGGWFDKETGKYYIDKNKVFSSYNDAFVFAVKKKQKAIFDLLKLKGIRVKKPRLPCVKKGNRYYNRLTKKFVSKNYAKRINNYFLRNPGGNLTRARGHYSVSKKKPFTEHSLEVRKLTKRKKQVVKTKDIEGKTVAYAPIEDKVIPKKFVRANLDFVVCGNVKAHLYRRTWDNRKIYHVFNWKIDDEYVDDMVYIYGKINYIPKISCVLRKISEFSRKYRLGRNHVYCHMSCVFFTRNDVFEFGRTWGFGFVGMRNWRSNVKKEFLGILRSLANSLKKTSYSGLVINEISFYVNEDIGFCDEKARELSSFRKGVL